MANRRRPRATSGAPARRPSVDADPMLESLCQQMLESAHHVDPADPLEAESWAAALIGTWRQAADVVGPDSVDFFGGAVVSLAERRGGPRAVGALEAIAAVAPSRLADTARAVARRVAARDGCHSDLSPAVGTAQATRAWTLTEPFGDQDVVLIAFRHERADGEHLVGGVVDHNLHGCLKDVIVADDAEEAVRLWGETDLSAGDPVLSPVAVKEAAAVLELAAARFDACAAAAEVADTDLFWLYPLLASRVATVDHEPLPTDHGRAGPGEVEGFLRDLFGGPHWAPLRGSATADKVAGEVVAALAEVGPMPPRFSPLAVVLLLLDGLVDRAALRATLSRREVDAVPEVVEAVIRHTAAVTGMPEAATALCLEALEESWPEAQPVLLAPRRPRLSRVELIAELSDDDDVEDEVLEAFYELFDTAPALEPPPRRRPARRTDHQLALPGLAT